MFLARAFGAGGLCLFWVREAVELVDAGAERQCKAKTDKQTKAGLPVGGTRC